MERKKYNSSFSLLLLHTEGQGFESRPFDRLQMEWKNWLTTPREGGGLSRSCWIAVYSRALLTL